MAKANSQQGFNIRHRLVGAIVLLGLGVVLIPMILQGKGPGAVMKSDSLTEEVQEWIVGTEDAKTYTTRVIPVGEKAGDAENELSALSSQTDTDIDISRDTNAQPELVEIVDKEGESGVEVAKTSQQAEIEPQPVIEESQQQQDNTNQQLQQTENKQQNTNQVAAVKLPEPAPITNLKSENVSRGWMVQVGTFSKAENAQNLISKLNKNGFDSKYEVINTDSGQATRVWVGPYEKRVTAGRALEAVKEKAGVKGFIKSYP